MTSRWPFQQKLTLITKMTISSFHWPHKHIKVVSFFILTFLYFLAYLIKMHIFQPFLGQEHPNAQLRATRWVYGTLRPMKKNSILCPVREGGGGREVQPVLAPRLKRLLIDRVRSFWHPCRNSIVLIVSQVV